MSKTILICDNPNLYSNSYDIVAYWESLDESHNAFSIPKLVEKNSSLLRETYLDWVFRLARVRINDKSVIDHLQIREDFSYWCMTLLVEKSQWKSPGLYQSFRLMALCMLIEEKKITTIEIKVSNRNVRKTIKQWSIDNKINHKVYNIKNKNSQNAINYFYNLVPNFIQAGISFFRYIYEYSVIKKNKEIVSSSSNSHGNITFFSYFFNLDKDSAAKSHFYTRYWTTLHDLIYERKQNINWMHIFIKNDVTPSFHDALKLVSQFNLNAKSNQSHNLLHSYMGAKVVKLALIDYFKIAFCSWKLRKIRSHFKIMNSGINLWYLMRDDWHSSLYGKHSIINCFLLNLFEISLNQLPRQKKGFYLMENQAWERALIYSWKNAGHGQIIGVQHTAISFWDLRYFFSPLENTIFDARIPKPDKVALNGNASIKMYKKGGGDMDSMVHVEALRYLYLDKQVSINLHSLSSNFKLLVLGDYLLKRTNLQLKILSEVISKLPNNLEIILKPHPATPVNSLDWPLLNMTITNDSLDQLVGKYDIAFCSNTTGAALDAYFSGSRVLIMLNPKTFNMSPLRELDDVEYISNSKDLLRALSIKKKKYNHKNDFFFINEKIPYWKKLLME